MNARARHVWPIGLLLLGGVLGWGARSLTFSSRDNQNAGSLLQPPQAPPPALTNPQKEGLHSSSAPSLGRISSSLAKDFDFPVDWDALKCVRESLNELNTYRRMQLFQRAMQRLTPETAAEMQKVFSEFDNKGRWYVAEYGFFLRRWGEIDGAKAMDFAITRGAHSEMGWSSYLRQLMSGWAVNEASGAVDWINQKAELPDWIHRTTVLGVMEGLVERNPDQAVEFALAQNDPAIQDRLFAGLTDRLIYGAGMERAEHWLLQIPDEPAVLRSKQQVFGQIIDRQLRGDVDIAVATVDRYQNEPWFNPAVIPQIMDSLKRDEAKNATTIERMQLIGDTALKE